jgi:hypothetical protein
MKKKEKNRGDLPRSSTVRFLVPPMGDKIERTNRYIQFQQWPELDMLKKKGTPGYVSFS